MVFSDLIKLDMRFDSASIYCCYFWGKRELLASLNIGFFSLGLYLELATLIPSLVSLINRKFASDSVINDRCFAFDRTWLPRPFGMRAILQYYVNLPHKGVDLVWVNLISIGLTRCEILIFFCCFSGRTSFLMYYSTSLRLRTAPKYALKVSIWNISLTHSVLQLEIVPFDKPAAQLSL